MICPHVTLGPPGTGKTTRLIERLADELRRGTPPDRIALVTFTRAACREVLDRIARELGLDRESMPWVRTIHSTAYQLLGLTPERVMGAARWREFAERYHYRLTDYHEADAITLSEPPRRTEDDVWRYVMMWGRNRRLDIHRALGRYGRWVSVTQTEILLKRAREFKKTEDVFDFADMIENCLLRGIRPDVDVAFIDEAQDLSPLQIAVVEHWFGPCERVYVAGDDDQAIFSFQGAEPEWLVGLAERCPTEILSQSHRVPAAVHRIAEKIIRRNANRVAKTYHPTGDEGEAMWIRPDDVVKGLDPAEKTLVLARNRMFLGPVARGLFDRRVPYLVEGAGGVNPYGHADRLEALTAALSLARGRAVPAESLGPMLDLVPGRGTDLVPYGAKTHVTVLTGLVEPAFLREHVGLGTLLDRMAADGPTSVLLKLRPADREYFAGIIRKYADVPAPRIRLTTIHAAKGREAHHVVVLPEMTTATYDESRDRARAGDAAENRVAYVAVTRAERRLSLVQPATMKSFNYPRPARPKSVLT